MKKFLISVLASVMIGSTLNSCGFRDISSTNSKKYGIELSISASDMTKKLVDKGMVSMPMPVDDKMASEIYHLNLDDIEEYGISETGRTPGNALIIIVKAKDGKVESAKESLDKVLEDKIGRAFYPEEKDILDSSDVMVRGNYISLFILPKDQLIEANKIYEDGFLSRD